MQEILFSILFIIFASIAYFYFVKYFMHRDMNKRIDGKNYYISFETFLYNLSLYNWKTPIKAYPNSYSPDEFDKTKLHAEIIQFNGKKYTIRIIDFHKYCILMNRIKVKEISINNIEWK